MSELKQEKEISISELVEEFQRLSSSIERQYSITVHLASISGKRWSYLSGKHQGSISSSMPRRILLNERLGLIVYGIKHQSFDDQKIKQHFKKIGATNLLREQRGVSKNF